MSDFEKKTIALRYWLHGKEYFNALKAMDYGLSWHDGMRRDGTTPEFSHQISIANFIRTLKCLTNEEMALQAAFLHDTVEDKEVSLTDIKEKFGEECALIVDLLSKETSSKDKKNITAYYEKLSTNPIASIVKGADRIHNFQTMVGVFTKDKQIKYIVECEELILPMLKEARRKFPEQETAYENIKHVLISQIELIRHAIKAESL